MAALPETQRTVLTGLVQHRVAAALDQARQDRPVRFGSGGQIRLPARFPSRGRSSPAQCAASVNKRLASQFGGGQLQNHLQPAHVAVAQRQPAAIGARQVVEYGRTEDVFTAPRERLTEDYVTGRFG